MARKSDLHGALAWRYSLSIQVSMASTRKEIFNNLVRDSLMKALENEHCLAYLYLYLPITIPIPISTELYEPTYSLGSSTKLHLSVPNVNELTRTMSPFSTTLFSRSSPSGLVVGIPRRVLGLPPLSSTPFPPFPFSSFPFPPVCLFGIVLVPRERKRERERESRLLPSLPLASKLSASTVLEN
ncbi:hypothetical protein V1478_013331 [Vespula squamosa]|uniref:Uncharacterized protein n=1 Tax=Vespula squamosa TaxID=30214 RepID=A0ABD2AAM6_VESSQ